MPSRTATNEPITAYSISLETAVAVTEISRRTWWRRLSAGRIRKHDEGQRGRTMVSLDELASSICIPMSREELSILRDADRGEADAQNDMGMLFSSAGKHAIALIWFRQAAAQEHADAMQHLARCYFAGLGVERDDNLGFMWLAKAAAHGNRIAMAQMRGLRGRWPAHECFESLSAFG